METSKYTRFLSRTKAEQTILISDIGEIEESIASLETLYADTGVAIQAMNTVGILVQQEYQGVVEQLVTQCLQYVYGDTHSFKMESTIKRNQPEMYLYLVIDGEQYSPRDEEVSGGQANVMAFALRVVLWAMQTDRTRPTLVFDEPFANLGAGIHTEAIREMLIYISEMLGLQFLILTHNRDIIGAGLNIHNVVMTQGVSHIEKVNQLLEK